MKRSILLAIVLVLIVSSSAIQLDDIKLEAIQKHHDNEFLVLTVNLHTYQEDNQEAKFDLLAKTIATYDIDVVLMQEAAQRKDTPYVIGDTIRSDNMVYILQQKLLNNYSLSYDFAWDWSHYGFTNYEEGVGILSKAPLKYVKSEYVSSSTSVNNIQARKIIYGQIDLNGIGKINVASAHLSWRLSETSEEQNNQIKNLQIAMNTLAVVRGGISIIGGDFNGNPTDDPPWNEGYVKMTQDGFTDTLLTAHPDANDKPRNSTYDTVKGDFPGRIDYIYMKANESYHVDASEIIFTPDTLGTISDHYAVATKFRFGEKLPDVTSSTSSSTSLSTSSTTNTSTTSTSTASSSNTSEMSSSQEMSSLSTTKSTPYFVEFALAVPLLMGWRRKVHLR